MDKSETYIKMCEKAKEIQDFHEWELFDKVKTRIQFVPNAEYIPTVVGMNIQELKLNIGLSVSRFVTKELCIWLPRQDQLQEMMKNHNSHHPIPVLWMQNLFGGFMGGYLFANIPDSKQFTSLEQLWLAFVMKENNKIWNGEDWVQA